MRRQTTFCDRCKKVIPEGLPDQSVALQNPAMSERFDLCFDCISPIRTYLEAGLTHSLSRDRINRGKAQDAPHNRKDARVSKTS